jgi:hypothetical protein
MVLETTTPPSTITRSRVAQMNASKNTLRDCINPVDVNRSVTSSSEFANRKRNTVEATDVVMERRTTPLRKGLLFRSVLA